MSISFPSPDEVADEYLANLKVLKPNVDISLTDSDWWIRSRVVGGVMAGLYQDQSLISDDAFPQSARHDALASHLQTLFLAPANVFKPATPSIGTVQITGTPGASVPDLMQMTYTPNGNTYQVPSGSGGTIPLSGIGNFSVESIGAGQSQNLLEGAVLQIGSPPSGVNGTATVVDGPLADGRNTETDTEAAARILARYQNPPAGGTKADYKNYAINADASVVDANVIRYIFGLGTMGVIVTAGTTDIDAAINAGDPIVRIPNQALLDKVLAALEAQVPETDCPFVIAPVEVPIDVTFKVRYVSGDDNTIPAVQLQGQTLTQKQLVIREIQRAIYKVPPGGRSIGGTGFVLASEIEEVVDQNLANTPYVQGNITQILEDRDCLDLSASGPNRFILGTQLAAPGNIIIESF